MINFLGVRLETFAIAWNFREMFLFSGQFGDKIFDRYFDKSYESSILWLQSFASGTDVFSRV